jgi:hypothetical protein
MSAHDIARQRLANQHLARPSLNDVHAIVSTLGAVQSQDYLAAKWAVGLRGRGLTDAAVERALSEGTIVRTHVLRPTWHFVAAEDIRWMLALSAARVKRAMSYGDRQLGLDDGIYRRANKAIVRALEGGKALTRVEIEKVYEKAKLDVSDPLRIGRMLMRSELDALICSGPRRGKQSTYALLDERVAHTKELARDDALAELARRYFPTRGPATLHDFAWWSGLTIAEGKRAVSMLGKEVESRAIEGTTYWQRPGRPRQARAVHAAHLLPNFDEYFVGFRDRSAIHGLLRDAGHGPSLRDLPGNVIVVDGQIVGDWKRTLTREGVLVELMPKTKLSADAKRGVADAARRFGEFLGRNVEIAWPARVR